MTTTTTTNNKQTNRYQNNMSLFSCATAAMFSFVGGGRSCEKKEEEEETEKKNDDDNDNDNDEYYDCCLVSATIDMDRSGEFAPPVAVAAEVSVITSSSFSSSRLSDNEEEEEEEEEYDSNIPITKKRRIHDYDQTTKMVSTGLKSTGLLDYCGPSGDGDDDDDGGDPHIEFFRKVLDSSKNGTTAPAATVPFTAPAKTASTTMSPSEERERVLHISMKIIEKEFQLLNRKAQYFQQKYLLQQEEDSKNHNKQFKDEIEKKKKDDDGPNNATTTTTTAAIVNCKGREEDILHVSFQLIQKQIQVLNERAQFFNSILLQEYTYKQTFQKEIEDTIIAGMNQKGKKKGKK